MRLSQSGNALIKKTASLVISAMACTLAFGLLPSPSVATTAQASNDLRNKASNDIAVSLNGKFTQGALLRGQAPVESKVFLNGKPVPTNKDGKFVVGFEREAPLQQTLTVEYGGGKTWQREITLEKREYNIQRIDGLAQKMVTPPAEVTARIKQDNINVANARSVNSDLDALFTRFEWPAKGVISGVYGSQRILNGVPKWPHYGLDFAAKEGVRIKAMLDGIVTLAKPDLYYTGGTLMFDHGHGISTIYLHMQKLLVKKGQKIKQGDVIGTVGSTGRATGAHLDVRLNWFQTRLDPETALPN